MPGYPTRRQVVAIIALSAFAPLAARAETTEELMAQQRQLSRRADDLAGKLIGPFNAKSAIAPWTSGEGYQTLTDFTVSADRLVKGMLADQQLRKNGEALRRLNGGLKSNLRAIPAMDGSSKIPKILGNMRNILLAIAQLGR